MTQPNSSNGQASRDPRETIGEWNELAYNSQTEAVHMCVLRTGAVLYYSGFRFAEGVQTETRLWYPQSELIKTPTTPADICAGHLLTDAGHSFLPDGRLLSTGGTLEYRRKGLLLRLQFNPKVRLAFHGATITTESSCFSRV